MRDVTITDEIIRLGQLLQLGGLADSGSEAKRMVSDGEVRVNGVVEERRGRQLHRGDVVAIGAEKLRVT
jgi:ribosome-associated protein